MENANKQICRLCLVLILDGDCEVIEESKKEILDILLIKIDFDISDNAVACNKCLGTLQNCFDFKSICFYVDDYIAPFVEGDIKVDIKNVFRKVIKTSENLNLDESQICRLCMSFIEDEAFNCYTSDLKDMIRNCLPEVNFNSVDEPLVCKPCLSNIIRYYKFMKSCKEVEQKIMNCIQNVEDHGIANKVILEDVLGLKDYDTLSKPIRSPWLAVENETECLKSEEAVNIKCEEIEIKDELDEVEMGETVKLGDDNSSGKNGSLKKTKVRKSNTKGKTFCCPKCPYSANKHGTFKKHMRTHLNNKVYTCTLCSFLTDARLSLKAHSTKVHRGPTKAYGCHECPYETDLKNDLQKHLVKHKDKSELEMHKCLLCSYESKYKASVSRHQKVEHSKNIKMYKCEKCSFSTKYKESLVGHRFLHTNPEDIPKYKGEECDFQTRCQNYLVKIHEDSHEDSVNKLKCEKCPYRCKQQQDLLQHMMIRCNKRAFSCDQCTYSVNHKGHLKRHKLVHQKDAVRQMYKCKLCDYQAKARGSIKNHTIKIHTDPSKVPTVKCTLCPYETTSKRYLSQHTSRCHKDQTTFQCTLCHYVTNVKEYFNKHSRTNHELIHTIKCQQCDFRTKQMGHLQRHMKLHESVKPPMIKCDKCEYSTWRKDKLNQHKVKHMELGETIAYKCAMCDHQTKYKSNLKHHIKVCSKKKKTIG